MHPHAQTSAAAYELTCLEGIKPFLVAELTRRITRFKWIGRQESRGVRIQYEGSVSELLALRTATTAWRILTYKGRRPTSILADRRLTDTIQQIAGTHRFNGFRIEGPGTESPAARRIRSHIANTCQIKEANQGDLLIRLRRSAITDNGWDCLIRLTPRPLSARPWRVAHERGALNATIAAAMIELTDPKPEDNYLNLCCGTGTLLIERALRAPTTFSCGIEINRRMLQATKTNLAAARVTAHIARMDVHNIGISPIFNAMTVDLPYGGAIGSHTHNTQLYPAILHAAARASRRGAVLVALTSHIRLLESAIASQRVWTTATLYRVYQGGLRPAIYVLTR